MMTLNGLLSLLISRQPNENPEPGLLITRRLTELLESTPARNTPDKDNAGCCQDD